MPHLVIVGGSDAGISAALRAREVDAALEVTVLHADRYPSFSVCGLPYYIGGEVRDFASLAHRSAGEIERHGVRLLLEHTAVAVDAAEGSVDAVDGSGCRRRLAYDTLILATGAAAALAPEARLQRSSATTVDIVGPLLPLVFGVGTAMPVLLLGLPLALGLNRASTGFNAVTRLDGVVRKLTGWVPIGAGAYLIVRLVVSLIT